MLGPIWTIAAARRRWLAIRGGVAVAALVVASSCSSDGVMDMRPTVDVGQQTAGIRRADTFQEASPGVYQQAEPEEQSYEEPAVTEMVEPAGTPMSTTEDAAYDDSDPAPIDEEQPSVPMSTEEDAETGDDADPEYVQPQPEPEEEQYSMAAPEEPWPEQQPERAAIVEIKPVAPPRRAMQAAYPRLNSPVERSASVMDSEEVSCRRELKKLGVRYQELRPIRDSRTCVIDHPIKVSAMGSVQMKPAATLDCRMALTFAKWTKNELAPSARWRYFSGIKTIHQGSSYSCRRIAGSGNPSAHSQGMALDVMAIELKNGKKIDVKKQGLFAFRAKRLLNNVRADGCEYFTTVLGPGYNHDHRDHFHFDLMKRRNGRRACH